MKVLQNKILPIFFIFALTHCSSYRTRANNPSEQTWDDLVLCSQQVKENPTAPRCETRFPKVTLTASYRELHHILSKIDLELTVSDSDYGARHLTCTLDELKSHVTVSQYSAGDSVTVQGTMSRIFESNSFTDVILDPCEIVASPAMPSPTPNDE